MSYCFSKIIESDFDAAIEHVTAKLAEVGFGVLTTIDVSATLNKKLDAGLKRYTILGACHPQSALKAIQAEDKIGTMLPCNVLLRETDDGKVEVAAVDPVASMSAIENDSLGGIAMEVQATLKGVVEGL